MLPRVQNFQVIKLLGKGSYGKVYKVQRNSDGDHYALKETDLGSMSQLERNDAVNEVRLLVSMNHVNVIRYHEAFLNQSKLCVIMEYAPFGDLKYYISKGQRLRAPFPEEAIWRIFLQLCKGLSHLHSNQIIHRDIKPANIFLCANDLLKIGDLGIAKALTRSSFAKTQIGTPCYMAPEVWEGKAYSYGSDLWSLGCVLYEMLTFKTPMEGRSMQELKMKIISGRYPPVPSGKYSSELISFCHSLLAMDPRKRPSVDAILSSSAASKWLKVLPAAPRSNGPNQPAVPQNAANGKLLNTIMVPRDLRELPKKLPPPSYDSDNVRPQRSSEPGSGVGKPASNDNIRPHRSSEPGNGVGKPASNAGGLRRISDNGGAIPQPPRARPGNLPSFARAPSAGRERPAAGADNKMMFPAIPKLQKQVSGGILCPAGLGRAPDGRRISAQ